MRLPDIEGPRHKMCLVSDVRWQITSLKNQLHVVEYQI